MPSKVTILKPSTFATIDGAFLEWADKTLNVHATTNEGWRKVPVFWLTAERAAQRRTRRDTFSDALVFPMISIERESVTKTDVAKRPIPGNIFPYDDYRKGSFSITRKINQEKTRNFANADMLKSKAYQVNFPSKDKFGKKIKNEKIVYQTRTIPMPVYYDIVYTINLRGDYQQQMNEMMSPFMVHTGGINQFLIKKDGYVYEAFIEAGYNQSNNLASLGEEEKKYETTVKVKVLGYIVGADKNQETPKVVVRENQVQIRFPREHVILGDINEYSIKDDKEKEPYRP